MKELKRFLNIHPTTVKANGDNHCHLHSTVYLLRGSQDQHLAFRQLLYSCVADEKNCMFLQSYILPEYKGGDDYNDRMKIRGNTWGME